MQGLYIMNNLHLNVPVWHSVTGTGQFFFFVLFFVVFFFFFFFGGGGGVFFLSAPVFSVCNFALA